MVVCSHVNVARPARAPAVEKDHQLVGIAIFDVKLVGRAGRTQRVAAWGNGRPRVCVGQVTA